MASALGIPLDNGRLANDVAAKIDDLVPLHDGEEDWELIENTRVAWLIMHEAALLPIEHDAPICLAG